MNLAWPIIRVMRKNLKFSTVTYLSLINSRLGKLKEATSQDILAPPGLVTCMLTILLDF